MANALIIRTAGTNCDRELDHAFQQAGATTETIHLNALIDHPDEFARFDLIGIPGGFSYGDDIAAGKIFALLMREHLFPALRDAIERGVPIFAPCNGFQVLVKMGLLPGPRAGESWPTDRAPDQEVTLVDNAGARFIDDWVGVELDVASPCIWTQGLTGTPETMMLPIAHGEGRFVASEEAMRRLDADHLIALRYTEAGNINGSTGRVAGICDATGLVFGLMPHPERYTQWTQHPFWTRLSDETRATEPLGLQMFKNAVSYVKSRGSVVAGA